MKFDKDACGLFTSRTQIMGFCFAKLYNLVGAYQRFEESTASIIRLEGEVGSKACKLFLRHSHAPTSLHDAAVRKAIARISTAVRI
jgi:hypothetical protein